MATVLEVIKKPIIYKFFNDFTDHINKTNSAIVFNREPSPNILNYRDHKTILKKKFLQTHIDRRVQLVRMKVQAHGSRETPLEYNQDQTKRIKSE